MVEAERRMNWVLPTPSLKQLALVKIATAMFNHDIVAQIAETYNNLSSGLLTEIAAEEWEAVDRRLESNVLALPLAPLFQTQLINLMKPLELEIAAWFDYHYEEYKTHRCDFPMEKSLLPREFLWSMRGTVDYRKTARAMLNEGSMDVNSRYELSCADCLEEEARELFTFLDEEQRLLYLQMDEINLISFFTRSFQSQPSSPDDDGDYENIVPFVRAVHRGNPDRCQYFYEKWSSQEIKEMYFEESVRLVDDGYALFRNANAIYLLSLMNEDTLEHLFRHFMGDLLICFLGWPMQTLFVEALDYGRTFMKPADHGRVLGNILLKVNRGFRDYDYSALFFEYWRLIPAKSKQEFLDDIYSLKKLFETKREEFVRLVFKEAPARQLRILCLRFQVVKELLRDRSVICDAALEELVKEAELNSSDEHQPDETERERNRYLSRLLNMIIASRSETKV